MGFYLLREKLSVIEEEARREIPPPPLEPFVDKLKLTDELKEWMKRTEITDLRGDIFLHELTNDDLMEIEEFQAAYLAANLKMLGLGFPRPKVKLSERKKNPEKWAKAHEKYVGEVAAYLELHPESRQHIDEELLEINPGPKWLKVVQRNNRRLRQATERLLHSRYVAAEGETDLEGVVRFQAPPGRYYLTNLWNEARAGDVKLRWELPIELPREQHYRLTLNNANALPLP